MAMIVLTAGDIRLAVVPELGAGIADFSIRGPSGYFFPIMRRAAPGETNASLLGSFFMAPWVNRIAGARFEFAGRERVLKPTSAPGTPPDQIVAQHGDVRKRPWSVVSQSATEATLVFRSSDFADINWPWSFQCEARYTLSPGRDRELGTLTIDLAITNTDQEPFPAGCGHHPYFMRRLWADRDDAHLRVPVAARYPLSNGCALGPAQPDDLTRRLAAGGPIPDEHIDVVFDADDPGAASAVMTWPSSGIALHIHPDEHLGHWVVFAPHEPGPHGSQPLSFIAVEPQSQVNNALNLDDHADPRRGTVTLDPDQSLRTRCRFTVIRIAEH